MKRNCHTVGMSMCSVLILLSLTILPCLSDGNGGSIDTATSHREGVYESSGVVVGDASRWENQTVILDGNLTVNSTGELTLYNVTLVINCTFNGQYGIFVESGGRLSIYESNITVWDTNTTVVIGDPSDPLVVSPGLKMRFEAYGNLTIERSRITYLWGEPVAEPPPNWRGGLSIFSNDVLLRDTTISRAEAIGLSASEVRNLRLTNVTFTLCNISATQIVDSQVTVRDAQAYDNGIGSGATFGFVESNYTVTNSHIHSNTQTGIWSEYSLGFLLGNNISNNRGSGLVTLGGTLKIEMNTLQDNWAQYGIFLQQDNGSQVMNNYLGGNGGFNNWGAGLFLSASRGTYLYGNSMVGNFGAGLHIMGGRWGPIVVENAIIDGNPLGIYTESNVGESYVINSTVSSTDYDIRVNLDDHPARETSNMTLLNTTFDRESILFMDLDSHLAVDWFMHVRVLNSSGLPVSGAYVQVRNAFDETIHEGTTDDDGNLKWLVVRECIQNDTNGDHDGSDPGEREMHTPHNITASKDGITGHANPLINESQTITIVLDIELPPRPPQLRNPQLTGSVSQDVLLFWNASKDDCPGGNVDHYSIYYGTQYDRGGTGYSFLVQVPAGNVTYLHENAGEGNPSNYFYYIQANDSLNRGSWKGQAAKFIRFLERGPNLVSIPLIQSDESIETVLQTVRYDKAWFYNSASQEWKWFMKHKKYRRGLWNINHIMGIWVNVTRGSNLTVAGIVPAQTMVHLQKGWNLVGFPSFNTTYAVSDLKAEVGATRVEGYDPSLPPYYSGVLGMSDVLVAGYAYWVRGEADVDWVLEVT